MRRLILIAAMSALVLAKPKPETYKESEDFQYSRSSSDDGTKSGFYGAQRGNMGGNYERAHNMDMLAQNQMSGLVRQVDGELGQGVKTRTGSVYTAANSRGIYGSGNYDLSNLEGRNFAEGESTGNSQSHSSLSSENSRFRGQSYSGMESSGFSSSHAKNSRYRGYQSSGQEDHRQIDNLHVVDKSKGFDEYENDNHAGYNINNYNTQYGARRRNEFDQSSANLHSSNGYDANLQTQYITTPVRVVIRPGGRVAIPVSAPTYSVSQKVLSENKNAVNSDAEILNQQTGFTPTNKAKHYEASYSYRKQWEKHHELPGDVSIAVPTENPFPKNSELYEDAQLLQSSKNQFQDINSLSAHSSNVNSNRAYIRSGASSRSTLQTGLNSQQGVSDFDSQQNQAAFNLQHSQLGSSLQQSHSGVHSQQRQADLDSQQSHLDFNAQQSIASSDTYANMHGRSTQASGIATDLTNSAGVDLKPKSYQSSYSYHKSWERQGDPYVIKPVGGNYGSKSSERLTAASSNSAAYSSHQFGSHSRQGHHGYSADCDDEGHIRVARSYDIGQQLEQNQNQWQELGQQTQSKWENLEDLGQQQQNKWDNLQNLGQQTINQMDNLQFEQTQNQWDNLQELGQQSQNQWDNLQQLGQLSQDKWDNLEDLGQQTQRNLEQHLNENLDQEVQVAEDFKKFEQQSNSQNENLDIFNQHNQKEDSFTNFEQSNSQSENLNIFNQHNQKEDSFTNFEQSNSQSENLDIFNQHNQKEASFTNFEQSNSQSKNLNIFNQHNQKEDILTNSEQKINSQNKNRDIFNQNNEKEDSFSNFEQSNSQSDNQDIFNEHNQKEDFLTNSEQQVTTQNENRDIFNQHNQKEDSLTNFEQQANSQNENQDIFSQHNQKGDSLSNFEQANIQNANIDIFNEQGHREVNDNIFNQHKPKGDSLSMFIQQAKGENVHDDDKLWPQNTDLNVFRNNTLNSYAYNFWHSNDFNRLNNSSKDGFSSGVTGNTLQSLWDKIDNIGGDMGVTESRSEDENRFYSHSQNVNHTQSGYSLMPAIYNIESANSNSNNKAEDESPGHNNLFYEPMRTTSTAIPMTLPPHSTKHKPENVVTLIEIQDQKPFYNKENSPSSDIGRGDIGSEETVFQIPAVDKNYKTLQEIETLSLSQEPQFRNTQPYHKQNKEEEIDNKLSVSNSNANYYRQYKLSSTMQKEAASTMHTIQISTTGKSNIYSTSTQSTDQPSLNELNLNTKPDKVQNVLLQDDIQQQNLEQQFEDYSQLQSAWFPSSNLQQGNDEQNMEQQFEVYHSLEKMHDQTILQDFEQQVSPSSSIRDVQGNPHQVQDTDLLVPSNIHEQKSQPSEDTRDKTVNTQLQEPVYVSHNNNINTSDQHLQKADDVIIPADPVSENPGFWKSIGTKFSNAKNKVVSWFNNS